MNYRGGVLTGVAATLLLVGAAAAGWWLWNEPLAGATKSAPPPIPATIPKPFKEDQATSVTLTLEAEARLAIRLGAVERKATERVRVYGGEVTVLPGQSIIVSAPLAGVLRPGGVSLHAGRGVTRGQPVLQLLPLLDPVGLANLTASKVDAEGQVATAQDQLRLAAVALDRAKKVLEGGAGSQRMVDEAQAQVDLAAKTLAASAARRDLLNTVVGQVEAGTTAAVDLKAPDDGILRTISAQPGQTVPAGAALFEVVNLDRVWVRVPVYVGDLPDVDANSPAAVANLSARPGHAARLARSVSAVPTANSAAGTADLFYALENRRWVPGAAAAGYAVFAADREHLYNPGERVGTTLPLKGPTDALRVATSAVVYDIHGGAWVYEKTGDRQYMRRRVVIRYVVNEVAVLASGPPEKTVVVTAGAAELFGTETGFSK